MEDTEEPNVIASRQCEPCLLKSAQQFYKVLDDLVFTSQTYRKKFELFIYPGERTEFQTTIEVRTHENRVCSNWNQNTLHIFYLTYVARRNRENIGLFDEVTSSEIFSEKNSGSETGGCCFSTRNKNLTEDNGLMDNLNKVTAETETKQSSLPRVTQSFLQDGLHCLNEYETQSSQNSPEVTYRYILDDELENACLLGQDLEGTTASDFNKFENFSLHKNTGRNKDGRYIDGCENDKILFNKTNLEGSMCGGAIDIGSFNKDMADDSDSDATIMDCVEEQDNTNVKSFLIPPSDEREIGQIIQPDSSGEIYSSSTSDLEKQGDILEPGKLIEKSYETKITSIKQEKHDVSDLDEDITSLNHIQIMGTWSIDEKQFSTSDSCEQDLTLHGNHNESNFKSEGTFLHQDNKSKVLVNCKRIRNKIDKKSLKSAVAVEKRISKEQSKQNASSLDDQFVIENVFGDVIYIMTEGGNCNTNTDNMKLDNGIDVKSSFENSNPDPDSIPVVTCITYPTGIIQNAYAPEVASSVFCSEDSLDKKHGRVLSDNKSVKQQKLMKVGKVKGNRKIISDMKQMPFKDVANKSKIRYSCGRKSNIHLLKKGCLHLSKKKPFVPKCKAKIISGKEKNIELDYLETGNDLKQRNQKNTEQLHSTKKRGRPKCKVVPSEEIKLVKRKPGRPKKVKPFVENESSADKMKEDGTQDEVVSKSNKPSGCTTKKKRGRPKGSNKKLIKERDDLNVMKNMSLIERGKFIDFWVSKRTNRQFGKFPFKVGRKRRISTLVNFETQLEKVKLSSVPKIKTVTKKGRGRPKKSFSFPATNGDVSSKEGIQPKEKCDSTKIYTGLDSNTRKDNDIINYMYKDLLPQNDVPRTSKSVNKIDKSDIKTDNAGDNGAHEMVLVTPERKTQVNNKFSNNIDLLSPEKSQPITVKPLNDQRHYRECVSEDLIVTPIAMKTVDNNQRHISSSSSVSIAERSSITSVPISNETTGSMKSLDLDAKGKKKSGRPRKLTMKIKGLNSKLSNAFCEEAKFCEISVNNSLQKSASKEFMTKWKKGRPPKKNSKRLKMTKLKFGLPNADQKKKRGRPSKTTEQIMKNDPLDNNGFVSNSHSTTATRKMSSHGKPCDESCVNKLTIDEDPEINSVKEKIIISESGKKKLKEKHKKLFHKLKNHSIRNTSKSHGDLNYDYDTKSAENQVGFENSKPNGKIGIFIQQKESEKNVGVKYLLHHSYGLNCDNGRCMIDDEGVECSKMTHKKSLRDETNLSLILSQRHSTDDVEMKPLERAQFPDNIIKKRGRPPKMPVLTCEKVESVENMFDIIKKGRLKTGNEYEIQDLAPTFDRDSKVMHANRIMKKYHSSLKNNCVTNINVIKKKRGRPKKESWLQHGPKKKEIHDLKFSSDVTSNFDVIKTETHIFNERHKKVNGCNSINSHLSQTVSPDKCRKKGRGRPKKLINKQKCDAVSSEHEGDFPIENKTKSFLSDSNELLSTCHEIQDQNLVENEQEVVGRKIELNSDGIVTVTLKKNMSRPKKILKDLKNGCNTKNKNKLHNAFGYNSGMNDLSVQKEQCEFSGSIKIKRKRGRYKNSPTDLCSDQPVKKKTKGRPKKVHTLIRQSNKNLGDIGAERSVHIDHVEGISMRLESGSSWEKFSELKKNVKKANIRKKRGRPRKTSILSTSEIPTNEKESQNSNSFTPAPVIQHVQSAGEVNINENELEMPVIDFEGSVSEEQCNSLRSSDVYVDKETLLTLTKIAGSKTETCKDNEILPTTNDKPVITDADLLDFNKTMDREDSCENSRADDSPSKDTLNAELSRLKCGFEVVFEMEDSDIQN